MKTLFKILFAPLLWIFQGCSPLGNPVDAEKSDSHYYNNSKSQIRYSPMGNWFELGNSPMSADVESFEVFNKWLSRDKDDLFFEAYKVIDHNIDLSTFQVKKEDYMTDIGFDKDFAYAFNKVHKNNTYLAVAKVIEGADPKIYTRTDFDWANDGKHHFYKDNMIDADFVSFQVLNDYFAKDNDRTYVRNNKIFEAFKADVANFKILAKSSHGIDKENVYWLPFFTKNSPNLLTIPNKSESNVEFLNRYFLRIADTIYFDGFARTDIDAQSFEIIDHSYAKDATRVYYKDAIILDADTSSFKKLKASNKYQDKNGTYSEGKLESKKSEALN